MALSCAALGVKLILIRRLDKMLLLLSLLASSTDFVAGREGYQHWQSEWEGHSDSSWTGHKLRDIAGMFVTNHMPILLSDIQDVNIGSDDFIKRMKLMSSFSILSI